MAKGCYFYLYNPKCPALLAIGSASLGALLSIQLEGKA